MTCYRQVVFLFADVLKNAHFISMPAKCGLRKAICCLRLYRGLLNSI